MAIYTDRITLVFPINDPKKKRSAAACVQTLEITESGNEFENVVPLDPEKVSDYAGGFSLPLIAENEKLTADLKTMTEERDKTVTDLTSMTEKRDEAVQLIATLTERVAILESQRDGLATSLATTEGDLITATNTINQLQETIAAHAALIGSLEQDNAQLTALVEALTAQNTDLESQIDHVVSGAGNRRLISPRAWQARFTQDEELDLSISTNPTIIQGLMAVKQLIQVKRLFSIDHPATAATLNAMIEAGVIIEARKQDLMRDSMASERVIER